MNNRISIPGMYFDFPLPTLSRLALGFTQSLIQPFQSVVEVNNAWNFCMMIEIRKSCRFRYDHLSAQRKRKYGCYAKFIWSPLGLIAINNEPPKLRVLNSSES